MLKITAFVAQKYTLNSTSQINGDFNSDSENAGYAARLLYGNIVDKIIHAQYAFVILYSENFYTTDCVFYFSGRCFEILSAMFTIFKD